MQFVADQVVDIAAEHQLVDRVLLEGAPQENSAHPARQAAETQEIHVDAREDQWQRAEVILKQREQEDKTVHMGFV